LPIEDNIDPYREGHRPFLLQMSSAVPYVMTRHISGQKYFENTTIMKQEIFAKLLESRQAYDGDSNTPVMILETTSPIDDYHDFYLVASKILRSDDLMGELSPGHVGILLANASIHDLPAIEGRLRKQGLSVCIYDRKVH
jgi:hypothetical protein